MCGSEEKTLERVCGPDSRGAGSPHHTSCCFLEILCAFKANTASRAPTYKVSLSSLSSKDE